MCGITHHTVSLSTKWFFVKKLVGKWLIVDGCFIPSYTMLIVQVLRWNSLSLSRPAQ